MDLKKSFPIDGDLKIHVTPNAMEAYIKVLGPQDGGNPVTLEQALTRLRGSGVVEGINIVRVQEALEKENWEKAVLVAEGVAAQDGKDARIEYHFTLPDKKIKLVESEDGRVNFRDLNLIYNVRRGELLAVRIPAQQGTPGITVTGKPVMPRLGRNLPLPRGKNTVLDESGNRLYATSDGHVVMVDNKISVFPVFEVQGDVDYSSGNIDFVGNVVIQGNITSGFSVKAGGDIEVRGVIESAEVFAGGNILVRNGIAGGHKATVKAGGSVYARFIENARIEAGEDVIINDGIVQSMLKVGRAIRAEGKIGTIVGGLLQAGDEISARVIGSSLSPQTILEVGVNPQLREEYKQIFQQYQDQKKAFDRLSQHLQAYQKSTISIDNLPDKKKLAVVRLLEQYKGVKEQLTRLEERKTWIEGEFERLQKGRVKVFDVVYPGVQIIIGQAIYSVNDPIKYALFTLDQGDVKVGTL